MMRITISLLSLTLLAFLASCGKSTSGNKNQAAAHRADTTPATTAAPMSEKDILNRLHQKNRMETEIARLAQERSDQAEVRDFANMLIRDHDENDRLVSDLAKREKIELRDVRSLGTSPGIPATPGATPGTPATPGSTPDATPGTPATPGSTPGTPTAPGTTPGTAPGTPATPGSTPGTAPATPATPGSTPGTAPATPANEGPGAISPAERADRDSAQSAFSRLQPLKCKEFDRAFLDAMIEDHTKTIKDLTDARSQLAGNT